MSFRITPRDATAGDRSGTVYELASDTVRAEVWPMWGFNCLRWQVRNPDGSWGSVLFTMPDWEANPVPTRSGQPILFPFPGRLKEGKLPYHGRTVQLPLNDSTKQHAIHGFTPRNPWRMVGAEADATGATITGEFHLSRDLPDAVSQWPADFALTVSYRLEKNSLTVDAHVENRGREPLPFGLGYHGYFTVPGGPPDEPVDRLILKTPAAQLWEAQDMLPTGQTLPVPAELDFRTPRAIGATALDHVLTKLGPPGPREGVRTLAELTSPDRPGKVTIAAGNAFRELVLFTPAHRKAVAIEPYTCAADASNLAAQGFDAGWREVPAGGSWIGTVEYRYSGVSEKPTS